MKTESLLLSGPVRGRQLFASPGPTNFPDSVLSAIARSASDFNDPAFRAAYAASREALARLIGTSQHLFMYTSSGHGAWEGTMINLFKRGETVLMVESGLHSDDWATLCEGIGLHVEHLQADRRRGVDVSLLREVLAADGTHTIKAVCVVHNETATGVVLPVDEIRETLDATGHPALLVVDAVSSIACCAVRMDAWGVDALIGSSQKGLMQPVGLGFTAVNARALSRHLKIDAPNGYFNWKTMLERPQRSFSGTAPNNLIFGLNEALRLIQEEGDERLYARHARLAGGVRAAVMAWSRGGGPSLYCLQPERASQSVTTVVMPEGWDAEPLRALLRSRFNVLLAGGLGDLFSRTFRIGHMGDLNEAMILGVLSCVELGMRALDIPHGKDGVQATLDYFSAF
ncbi:pyridoxal-phosphate-dependent aminotransferase family protein [Burkholderia sp. WSM2232]|uniref:pyridoxal-phosphate-dependent aminotransferase family protein n=1 Tax=Burkholderia sp. WSM2232 TaxID=944436 RepID=UPI000483B0BE|nr:alanine--glyoxylate aminotransferase family protein [Burkholderia sp. WSM2232]